MTGSVPGVDTSNPLFQKALRLVEDTSHSVFLTGRAGTGKSTFLRYICQTTKKKFVVLAPTGIAAIHVGGQTLHSFFKLPFRPLLPDDPDLSPHDSRIFSVLKYRKSHIKLIQETELIIIDEISMVRADILDSIDRILRIYTQNMRLPFGGKQLLMVGDVYQLEPVVKSDEWGILSRFYATPYFFGARVFQQIPLVSIELQQVYRQKDPVFINLLDKIRNNRANQLDLSLINNRYNPQFTPDTRGMYVTLATRRDTVDYINDRKLEELPDDPLVFKGEVKGEFNEHNLPTALKLELKKDAQVMFVKNDPDKRWFNGSLGKVNRIDSKSISVMLDSGKELEVQKEIWVNVRYKYDEKKKKIIEEELGSFKQYPLKLAWALTVHKSQGLTFENVIIDFGGGAFAGGQTYVALSRCTSLEGIVLKNRVRPSDIIVRAEVLQFANQFNNEKTIEKSLRSGQANKLYRQVVEAFDQRRFDDLLEVFFKAIRASYVLEKPLVKRYIRRKLGVITHLEKRIKELEERLEEQRKGVEDFAHEYYLMGNECVVKAHDYQAAIANFNKALKLNPCYLDAWIRRGVTYLDSGDAKNGEKDFSKAISLSPRSFKAWYNRGRCRLELKNFEGARQDLEKAIQIKHKHAPSFYYLGNAYSSLGDPTTAMEYWELARRLGFRE